jgi:hypothetical protein
MASKNWMAEAMVRHANEYISMDVEKFEVPDYLKGYHPDFTREQYIAQYKADTLRIVALLALFESSKIGEKFFGDIVDEVNLASEIHKSVEVRKLTKEKL